MKRVLIIDDSAFVRKLLKDLLNDSGQLTVVGTARDGAEGVELVSRLAPDVVTLDVEMPKMNGVETLSKIMQVRPTPVVMLSTLTTEGADVSMSCLALGAVDAAAKPIAHGLPQLKAIANELIGKIVAASQVDPRKLGAKAPSVASPVVRSVFSRISNVLPIVVVASSTGGPRALRYLVPRLSPEPKAAYLIVQHLPVGFTATMARDLDALSALSVREAAAGDSLQAGTVLLAPAGRHCCVTRGERIELTDDPPLWGVRPAADMAMSTAAAVFGSRVISVVLTGMGRDGAHGTELVKSRGGTTLAEHESTCIIYGMPRSAVETGAVDRVVPLDEMPDAVASAIAEVASGSRSRAAS